MRSAWLYFAAIARTDSFFFFDYLLVYSGHFCSAFLKVTLVGVRLLLLLSLLITLRVATVSIGIIITLKTARYKSVLLRVGCCYTSNPMPW